MKIVRVVMIALAIIVAGLVAPFVLVAFNSSFQTWAVRRVLAEEPSLHVAVGTVSNCGAR